MFRSYLKSFIPCFLQLLQIHFLLVFLLFLVLIHHFGNFFFIYLGTVEILQKLYNHDSSILQPSLQHNVVLPVCFYNFSFFVCVNIWAGLTTFGLTNNGCG